MTDVTLILSTFDLVDAFIFLSHESVILINNQYKY